MVDQSSQPSAIEDVAVSGPERRRVSGRLVILLLLTMALMVLIFNDARLLRTFFAFDLPFWTWEVEHVASEWGHLISIGLGALLVLIRDRRWLLHMAVTVLVGSLIVFFFKFGFGRVRPCDSGDPLLFFGPNVVHDGYPSGHAVAMWGAVFVVMRCYPRLGWVWLGMGLFIAWARMHAQAHYASDLLAAAVVALGTEDVSYSTLFRATGRKRLAIIATSWLLVVIVPPLIAWPKRTDIPPPMTQSEYDAVVRELYTRILNRPVDDWAYDLWMEKLPRVRVVSDPLFQFAVSGEFYRSVRGWPTPEARAIEIYRRLLDRPPTAVELDRAMPLLQDDDGTLKWGIRLLATRLILSEEYLERFGSFTMPGDPRLAGKQSDHGS